MKRLKGHAISGVFVFLLLGIFALMSVVTVLFGANAYKNSSDRAQAHNTRRVLSSYVRAMARSWDSLGGIYTERADAVRVSYEGDSDEPAVESLGAVDSVVLVRDDEDVIDRLYVFDGKLMERLQYKDEPFEPERGMEICPADALSVQSSDGLISLTVAYGDETATVDIAPRSGR